MVASHEPVAVAATPPRRCAVAPPRHRAAALAVCSAEMLTRARCLWTPLTVDPADCGPR